MPLASYILSCSHVLSFMYGSAEQDRSLYGNPETQQSIQPHSDLNCYLLLLLLLSLSLILVIKIISILLKMFSWFLAVLFQRYCFCPTGCLVLLYLHVFSGLSVLFWSGMCNWDRMFPVLHHGAVPLPAAHLLAPNVSTQINVTKYWFTLNSNHSIRRVYFVR